MNRLLKRANSRVSLGSAATLLVVVTLLSQFLGFLRNRLISTNFTVFDPGSSDAFFVAFQIPDFFYYTIAAGALGVAFIPFLSDKLAAGNKKAIWEITSSLLNLLTIVMAGVAAILFIFAQPLIHALAPNLPPDHLHEAVLMTRLIAVNPLLFTLSGIITSVQQTFGRFFFFAFSPLVYNLSIIASIYLFKDSMGIVGLGVGALIGGALQLIVALFGMAGLSFKWRPIIKWRSPDFKGILRQLPPRSLDQGIDQLNSVVETNRAQALGTGPVSWYNFAFTLHYVPIMLIGNSIATAAFPRLTERLAQGRPDLFRKDFIQILEVIIWLLMPVVVIGYFARGYMARFIFGDVSSEVALIFGYLTAAIFFRSVYAFISRYFYAQKDNVTPLLVSILAIGLNIFLAFTLARSDSWGISGLALAQSIVAAVEVGILVVVMIIRDRQIFSLSFISSLVKIVSVTGFAVVTTYIMATLLPIHVSDRGIVTLGSKLVAISFATIFVYVSISSLFGLKEASAVLGKLKQIILKPIKVS